MDSFGFFLKAEGMSFHSPGKEMIKKNIRRLAKQEAIFGVATFGRLV
jgi:hypothetical protein